VALRFAVSRYAVLGRPVGARRLCTVLGVSVWPGRVAGCAEGERHLGALSWQSATQSNSTAIPPVGSPSAAPVDTHPTAADCPHRGQISHVMPSLGFGTIVTPPFLIAAGLGCGKRWLSVLPLL
jgi:hypothetical protein